MDFPGFTNVRMQITKDFLLPDSYHDLSQSLVFFTLKVFIKINYKNVSDKRFAFVHSDINSTNYYYHNTNTIPIETNQYVNEEISTIFW